MARTSTKMARPVPDADDAPLIKIIRHQIVAEIVADPHGDHPPLRAAFMAASDYIAEEAGPGATPVSVEFEYLGGTFRAGYAPTPETGDGRNLNDVSDERLASACRDRGMDVYPAA